MRRVKMDNYIQIRFESVNHLRIRSKNPITKDGMTAYKQELSRIFLEQLKNVLSESSVVEFMDSCKFYFIGEKEE